MPPLLVCPICGAGGQIQPLPGQSVWLLVCPDCVHQPSRNTAV